MRGPLADQCGFAKASRSRDERQLATKTQAFLKDVLAQAFIEPLDQAWARDNFGPDRRDMQFRLQERNLLHAHPFCTVTTDPGCKYIMLLIDCQWKSKALDLE